MGSPRRQVSDRALELFALGELPAAEAAALETQMAGEPELAERLRALRASSEEILAQYAPAAVVREVERRAQAAQPAPRPRPWRPLAFAAGTALAGALAVVLVVNSGTGPGEEPGAGDRLKGATPHLLALVVRGARAERLADGAVVAPGDAVQLAYAAAGMTHGVIVSVDGRGEVTLHWPENPREPARLEPASQVVLPHAFQLDDAPGFERFILVAAREPVDVARVLEAARAAPAGPLDLPRAWVQSSLRLRKATR